MTSFSRKFSDNFLNQNLITSHPRATCCLLRMVSYVLIRHKLMPFIIPRFIQPNINLINVLLIYVGFFFIQKSDGRKFLEEF